MLTFLIAISLLFSTYWKGSRICFVLILFFFCFLFKTVYVSRISGRIPDIKKPEIRPSDIRCNPNRVYMQQMKKGVKLGLTYANMTWWGKPLGMDRTLVCRPITNIRIEKLCNADLWGLQNKSRFTGVCRGYKINSSVRNFWIDLLNEVKSKIWLKFYREFDRKSKQG